MVEITDTKQNIGKQKNENKKTQNKKTKTKTKKNKNEDSLSHLNKDKECIGCGACYKMCPDYCIEIIDEKA